MPDVTHRCDCGAVWAKGPTPGQCARCGSAVSTPDSPPDSPYIGWASTVQADGCAYLRGESV